MRRRIGITLGDPAGIGPEVVEKALASGKLDRQFDYEIVRAPTPRQALEIAARRCLAGELVGVATGPIAKRQVAPWPGQTEFLAHLSRTKRFAMMLATDKLRVAVVTTHLPLRQVADQITGRKIREVVALTNDFCRRLGIRRPRIAVTGLNPHAGEGGLLGDEERRIIAPAIKRSINATGPHSADTIFYRAYHGQFDAVVAMYHDQGLGPFKLLAFDNGVNVTLGLPFIRTSPDHGTAPDIAGKGIARPDGMIAAINLIAKLAGKR
ncbi:MAG: D-threonate 4-phosphate dehydrogenase [Verrucomicrobiae bacterium]|nr:D-threonate 4-phosphate dehydrogenase [Verrucomicrobiae bacterium]